MLRAAFYKGTRPGVQGVYSWAVRTWEKGPHSHCELIFSDGMSASASFVDGGVRFKEVSYDPEHWDFILLPSHLEGPARGWFEVHEDEGYDIRGNLHFVVGPIPESRGKKFCSEAVAAAVGVTDAWRFGPNALYHLLLHAYPQPTNPT